MRVQIVAERKEGVLLEAVTMTVSPGEYSFPFNASISMILVQNRETPRLKKWVVLHEVISKAGAIEEFFDLGFALLLKHILIACIFFSSFEWKARNSEGR